jgi:predicted ATPase
LRKVAFPDTVQGVITSRIDRLTPQSQLTLKIASVIGTAFSAQVVKDIHPIGMDVPHLAEHLEALERADLTVRDPHSTELVYRFKHMITREVAYNQLLFAQRQKLHLSVAEWYETRFADDLTQSYAVLAHHYRLAEVTPKAVEYLEKSAVLTFSIGLGKESVTLGLEAARLLGVDLPEDPKAIIPLLGAELGEIQRLLAGRAPKDLLDLPPLANAEVGAVLGLLLRIEPFAHQSMQPELFALMALRSMTLTLTHGNGMPSPAVYAMYSIVYRAMTGDSTTAHQLSQLALDLDARQGEYLKALVSFVHTWFNQHWMNHVSEGIETSLAAARAGFAGGDILFGCFNLSAHVVYLANTGRRLEEVAAVAAKHLRENGKRVLNAAFHCVHELQMAKALAGLTVDRLSFTDADFDEAVDVASICKTDHYNQIGYYFTSKLRLHYYYGDYERALEHADRALPLLPAFAGQVGEVDLTFFRALSLLARAREVSGADRQELTEKARADLAKLAAWGTLSEPNFRHKTLLVEAELARIEQSRDEAIDKYAEAAVEAAKWGYVQHEALARELDASFRRSIGDDAGSRTALDAAIERYAAWGAHAKVLHLSTS